jgi:hypothetical protein
MVGLTRFFGLMNLCEKSGVLANVYAGFSPLQKDANFRGRKKLFVLQAGPRHFLPTLAGEGDVTQNDGAGAF